MYPHWQFGTVGSVGIVTAVVVATIVQEILLPRVLGENKPSSYKICIYYLYCFLVILPIVKAFESDSNERLPWPQYVLAFLRFGSPDTDTASLSWAQFCV